MKSLSNFIARNILILAQNPDDTIKRMNTTKNPGLFIIIPLIIFLAFFTQNRGTGSDPRGTLLVSEQILLHGSVKLDAYGTEAMRTFGHMVHQKNGHFYYYFPIGSSLASIPFVAAARLIGTDIMMSEGTLQIIIACITTILTFIILLKLARLFMRNNDALFISSVFLLGSSLSSTALTALWSHNFATLFALLAIYLFVRIVKNSQDGLWPWLAACLFAAYLCRPTLSLLSPMLLLALFANRRILAIKTAVFLGGLLVLFMCWSLYEFSQPLPDYYSPKRLETHTFKEALLGNLLSPARGLLVYSPFIAVVWLCFGASRRPLNLGKSWLLIGLAWPLLHLAFISKFPHWWGGYSYGSRFMTDILPGLFLLTIHVWPSLRQISKRPFIAAPLFASILFAVLINTGQGLFNRYTAQWNAEPSIDQNSHYLFDWRYPQFLANPSGHQARLLRDADNKIVYFPAVSLGEIVSHDSDKLFFMGWHQAEANHRWSSAKKASLFFNVHAPSPEGYKLQLFAEPLGKQRLFLFINEELIHNGFVQTLEITIAANQLKTVGNKLTFEFPDARQPGNGDPRTLAMAFKGMQLLANTPGGIPEESPNIP